MKKDKLRDATGDKGASALAADAERVGDHWDAIGLARVEEPNLSPQKGPLAAGENLMEWCSSRIVAPPAGGGGSAIQERPAHQRLQVHFRLERILEGADGAVRGGAEGAAYPSTSAWSQASRHGAARWHQPRPPDYDSQARRKIAVNPNPEGGIYGTDLAFKKISNRVASEEKADGRAAEKRTLDLAWRLCGGRCQCNPAEGEKRPVWDLMECRNCKKFQKSLRDCGTCGTCASKRARNASSALAITNA
jgi:hypothetical protein